MSKDDLELIFGEALLADEFGAKDQSDGEKRAAARRWFQAQLSGLRTLVCQNPSIAGYLGPEAKDRNALLSVLIDILGSQYGQTVPVAALSAQVLHYGIDKLCTCSESGSGPQSGLRRSRLTSVL
ncbi:hypothetical protein ABZS61_17430 [Streptomyces sp. NPDC005566]|uniref:hypothetical protein n=1 Tax=Streptomyces sp. NPDC005566 TaxID=3156886 RepID=UPI0033B039DA